MRRAAQPAMEQRKKLRDVVGILKDKASLIRTALFFTCTASTAAATRLAVLRATSHHADSPPQDHRVAAVLDLGHRHRLAAYSCVQALMDRLHGTRNASVALKCLIVLHGAANARGSPENPSSSSSSLLRDHLAVFPSSGGYNFLNLAAFRDDSDPELSAWVRWFAGVLEHNIRCSRILWKKKKATQSDKTTQGNPDPQILKEIVSLGNFVEQVGDAPESLHLQRNNLVYQVVMLAGDDYGSAQKEIGSRVEKLGGRIGESAPSDSAELIGELQRLESFKERLSKLFVNRKRNDLFWDLIGRTKAELVKKRREWEERRVVQLQRRGESSELTLYGARVAGRPEQLFRLPTGGRGSSASSSSRWLDKDRLALTVSAVG